MGYYDPSGYCGKAKENAFNANKEPFVMDLQLFGKKPKKPSVENVEFKIPKNYKVPDVYKNQYRDLYENLPNKGMWPKGQPLSKVKEMKLQASKMNLIKFLEVMVNL